MASGTAAVDLGGALDLGGNGNGFVNVGGGNTFVRGNIQVGQNSGSTGTLTLTGGNLTTFGLISLAPNAGATGTVNLNGGVLTTRGLTRGPGTSAFNFGGGTLRAGVPFASDVPLAVGAGGGTIDTANYRVQLGGALTGVGNLLKTGTGTLILDSSASSLGGGLTVNGGTVAIRDSNALGTGAITVNGSGLSFNSQPGLFEGRLWSPGGWCVADPNPSTSVQLVTRWGNAGTPAWYNNTTDNTKVSEGIPAISSDTLATSTAATSTTPGRATSPTPSPRTLTTRRPSRLTATSW